MNNDQLKISQIGNLSIRMELNLTPFLQIHAVGMRYG
jgi:hypothetical protein